MSIQLVTKLILGGFLFSIPTYALYKKLNIFSLFKEGSIDGIKTIIRIFPYMLGMIIAIGMLRTAGAFEIIAKLCEPFLILLGIPSDIVPLAITRPLSGSASNAVFANIVNTHGGDALISKISALIMGSTETTFYVIAIYFGSVGIKKTRHAIPAGLLADAAGIAAAIFFGRLFFL